MTMGRVGLVARVKICVNCGESGRVEDFINCFFCLLVNLYVWHNGRNLCTLTYPCNRQSQCFAVLETRPDWVVVINRNSSLVVLGTGTAT